MAKAREILKTTDDELVLEKFFNEYIVSWYHGKSISSVVYNKARKEIEALKNKKIKGKKKNQTNITETVEKDIGDVRSLPDTGLKGSKVNAQKRPTSVKSRASVDSAQSRFTQPNPTQTKPNDRQQTNRKEEVDLQRLLSENHDMKKRLEEMEEEISNTRADADVELRDKEQQLERLRKALDNSVEQVNMLTLRLSKLAGDKLRQGNPDLADLSDPNRPTELGTRFSEIYDNEWSDAFEHMSFEDEEQRVRSLHGIIMAAFSFCYEKFEKQTYQVRATMLCLEQEDFRTDRMSDKTIRTTQIHNVLSDLRKETSSETSKNVANEFLSAKFENYISGFGLERTKIDPTLRTYARKCAEICWFMMVCDPHMALSKDKEGAEFDTNVYKPYTQSVRNMKRPIVKLNVWPALLLHMSGPLVAKGVAQPGEGKAN